MGYLESGEAAKITSYDDAIRRFMDLSGTDGFSMIRSFLGKLSLNRSYIDRSYAADTPSATGADYQNRPIYVIGDKIGTLVDSNNAPIQETVTGTGIDLNAVDTTGYVAYF